MSARQKTMAIVLVAMMALAAGVSIAALYASGTMQFGFETAAARSPAAARLDIDKLTISDPELLEPLAPEEAIKANEAIAMAGTPNPSATPLVVPLANGLDFTRSLDCMTAAIYYEAANEPTDGQRAVAQVILNRVRHPAYPNTICGVVFQGSERRTGCQFSFTCDGSLARVPSRSGWFRAQLVASEALAGRVYAPVGWATHYHANYVLPYWASSLLKTATIGAHIFYRWNGGWGQPRTFANGYGGNEPAGVFQVKADLATTDAALATATDASATAATGRTVLAQDAQLAVADGARPRAVGNRWVLGSDPAAAPASQGDARVSTDAPSAARAGHGGFDGAAAQASSR